MLHRFRHTPPVGASPLNRNKSSYCAEYQDVYDALVAAGDMPPANIAAQQDLMVRTIVDGMGWADTFDFAYLLGQYSDNGGGGLINLINPGTFNAVKVPNGGVITFTSNKGTNGDATQSYIDTNYNPNDDGINYALNSASFGFYSLSDIDASQAPMGTEDGPPNRCIIQPRYTDTISAFWLNGPAETFPASVADSLGMYIASRTGVNTSAMWKNKNLIGNSANASSIIPDYNFFIHAVNDDGTADTFDNRIIGFAFAAKGIIKAQADILTDAVNDYFAYFGYNVY